MSSEPDNLTPTSPSPHSTIHPLDDSTTRRLDHSSTRPQLLISLFLIMATLAVYWQVQNHDFVNYDDGLYVTENRQVQRGLTLEGIVYAFTSTHAGNWHPITWLSHILDCQIYGLNPAGHHWTNLQLHIVTTLLLFLVLKSMSGGLWQSALVAVLFALHPLHVESVAWVAERKDVLSAFFLMLTIWAYLGFVRRPGLGRYLLVIIAFACGLMSKPMLVTLPFLLILLDYWPLARFQSGKPTVARLILEKAPLFLLAAGSSLVTFWVQQQSGYVMPCESIPIDIRIMNALISYVGYIGKMLWPASLSVFYPYSTCFPLWQTAASFALLVFAIVFAIRMRHRFPYMVVGLFWYLGTLLPVIGLIQVGSQAMADRYTYIPLIGIFVVIAWGISDLLTKWDRKRMIFAASSAILVFPLMICAHVQVRYWQNSGTLFEHAISVTTKNKVAHNNLGLAALHEQRYGDAVAHFSEALRISPNYVRGHNNLGIVLTRQGKTEKAISHLKEALRLKPEYQKAHLNMGVALYSEEKFDEAISHYLEALRIKPDDAAAHNNLGAALVKQSKISEGVSRFRTALQIDPYHVGAADNLKTCWKAYIGADR